MTRQGESAGGSREKILEVAESLFARRGFAGVGLREIAQAVGLGKSSLFHHFEGKAQLYLVVLGRVQGNITSRAGLEIRAGGRVVGYVIYQTTGLAMDVYRIGVDPAWRRRGVGEALLRHACRVAAKEGCRAVVLEVRRDDPAALGFYRALGFGAVGVRSAKPPG